jgi:hypothetical protein
VVEAHIASSSQCGEELETLRPVADGLVFWPTDVLRPPASLQEYPLYLRAVVFCVEPGVITSSARRSSRESDPPRECF